VAATSINKNPRYRQYDLDRVRNVLVALTSKPAINASIMGNVTTPDQVTTPFKPWSLK
jgi:hypothetical protein